MACVGWRTTWKSHFSEELLPKRSGLVPAALSLTASYFSDFEPREYPAIIHPSERVCVCVRP